MPNYNDILSQVKIKAHDPHVELVLKLFSLKIEEWKDSLVDAKGETRDELQGAIRRVRGVLFDVNRKVTRSEYKDGAYKGD
jgi:hypothetical protein